MEEVKLLETTDARVWTKEFMRIIDPSRFPENAIDENIMIAWFANAMVAGEMQNRRNMLKVLAYCGIDYERVSQTYNQLTADPEPIKSKFNLEAIAKSLDTIEKAVEALGQEFSDSMVESIKAFDPLDTNLDRGVGIDDFYKDFASIKWIPNSDRRVPRFSNEKPIHKNVPLESD